LLRFFFKPSCGVCKKAKAYLDRRGIDYEAVDILRTPPPRELLARAIDPADPKKSLNARSGSFRRKGLAGRPLTAAEALDLMVEDPSLIRRPFIIDRDRVYQGFDEGSFEAFLG
jgi:arsenate reductase